MAATLDDIARETGFHRTTVSKVLSGDKRCYASAATRRLIQETAERLHFVPNYFALSLQTRQSRMVGVAAQLDRAGVTLKAIVDGLREARYMALFCDCSSGAEETRGVLRRMHGRRVDGIILYAEIAENRLSDVLPGEVPVVAVRSDEVAGVPCVVDERRQAFAHGVQWLVERGHRRIAFMGRDNREALANPHNTHSLKIAGYQDAMRRLGLHDEALLLDAGSARGDVHAFVLAHADLFRSITAVLACSDLTAVEVLSALAELGLRVPEDCSVIGFDDTDFAAAVRPRLTSFRPRRAEVGRRAVELLLKRMNGETVDCVTLVPELIERESAGACGKCVSAVQHDRRC